MPNSLADLAQMQREFDARHGTRGQSWGVPINQENTPLLLEFTVALAGEVGEFANLVKKIARGDFTVDAAKPDLGTELADILIYLMKLANQLGINLEDAFLRKLSYNETRFAKFGLEPPK